MRVLAEAIEVTKIAKRNNIDRMPRSRAQGVFPEEAEEAREKSLPGRELSSRLSEIILITVVMHP